MAVWEFQQGFNYGSVCLANGGAMMFDLNHKFKVIFNNILFFISFICLAALTACGGSSSSDGIDEILGDDFSDTALTLSGRVIKGVLENANVSIYHVINGEISQIPVKSSITDINGSYEIITPGGAMFKTSDTNAFSGIIYVEATPSKDPLQPTLMTCDAINGCGVKNDIVINFGDTFPVNKDFKLRGYAIVDLKSTHSSTQLTPWSHIVVAYAETLPGGLSISNINQAITYFSELFLFTQSVNTINAIDLTVISEIDEASDYGVTAAIITSSLLNIGQSPNFLNIETVLSTLTTQGGLLLNNDSDDPERLSFLNIARQSLNNIPNHLSDRPNIETHLNKIYEKALNSTNDIEIDIVSGSDGNITSSSHNFECSEICQYNITKDEIITLNAIADNGFEFTSWNGTCPGLIDQSYPVCEFNVTKPTKVQAEFSPLNKITHNLIITIAGSGLVNLNNEGFTCNSNCVFTLDENTLVDLSALPSSGYHIETWDLDNNSVCGTNLKCEVIMLEDHNLHIVFNEDTPPPVEFVTLSVQTNGPGIVTDSGLNLECQQADCLFQIEKGSTVHFTARPMDNLKYEFTGWQGLCSGSGSCIRTLNSNDTLTANFNALPKQTINFGVSEGGSVIDTALNISCTQITCSTDLDFGTQVNLKAIANNGYTFDHWENDCSGVSDKCSVLMDSNRTVSAVFSALPKQSLTIIVSQGGSVFEPDLNIICAQGNTCSIDLDIDTKTNLKAQANAGYVFDHWENDCTNLNDTCSLTIKSDHTAKAVFKTLTSSTSVNWTPPTQRENGDELSLPEIKKYIIYYGVKSNVYIDAIEVSYSTDEGKVPTELVIQGLEKNVVYYFAGMTVDTDNVSSILSNEISRLIE